MIYEIRKPSMAKLQGLVLEAAGREFVYTTIELKPLQPKEVLVRLKATGVCHTDISIQEGRIPAPFPLVLGHEGGGIVEQVGKEVTTVKVGDHVLLSYSFCGECHTCRQEKPFACEHMLSRNFGCTRPDGSCPISRAGTEMHGCFFGQSSFANPALVQEACCVPVDKSLPLEVLAPLGCGIQTGAGAVFNIVQPVEKRVRSLVIFGIGGVGSAAVMAAKYLSSTTSGVLNAIVAVDTKDHRLALARTLGATHTIDASDADYLSRIAEICGASGADAAIDCTGSLQVINDMIVALGPCGTAVTIGAPPATSRMSIEVFPFINGCKTYRGSHAGDSVAKKVNVMLCEFAQS
jgi:aryl-alcohol dehydrogenase